MSFEQKRSKKKNILIQFTKSPVRPLAVNAKFCQAPELTMRTVEEEVSESFSFAFYF